VVIITEIDQDFEMQGEIVKVTVGTSNVEIWMIHEELLTSKSDVASLRLKSIEGEQGSFVVNLPEIEPASFA
jgi:hypothetical protein